MSVPAREPRRHWRLAAAVVICLLIGAAVNVLVAWGTCVHPPLTAGTMLFPSVTGKGLGRWPHAYGQSWGKPRSAEATATWNITLHTAHWNNARDTEWGTLESRWWLEARLSGLPFRSMMLALEVHQTPRRIETWHDAQEIRVKRFVGLLPTRPLWAGFAANTLIYAALAGGLWQLVALVRRCCRRPDNQCPTCGYDRAGLAADAKCPECGAGRAATSGTMPV